MILNFKYKHAIMRPYDDYDVAKDIEAVESDCYSGTSYTGADPRDDVNDARDRLEGIEIGFYPPLRGDWEHD